MEAKAMYNFDASQQDELSFRRGDVLVIRNMEDKDWYQAQLGARTGYIPATYVELEKNEWYKGKMSRAEAEMFLMKTNSQGHHVYPDGTFIVRDCESDRNQFSLSVKHGSCPQHFKILSNQDGQYYLWPHKYFTSINELINHHRTNSVARDSRTVILLKDLQEPQAGVQLFEAEHDFHPEAPEEVGFRRGDKIILLEKTDENWWTGQVQSSGEQGLFPRNYVREVKN
ncbi:growth factor receptor-bound protein 2-like isoform X2 [Pomacea canaliculata]|uniref:growth factor receptor-bound protein 2-like isoform X2 n=1 Tax=Pomacea canaliculata TaxID=400727 RepID=UPI000D733208|nr:growth factor receptor-bound protein 2-like isoform X2 [Pomacea canaliculata]